MWNKYTMEFYLTIKRNKILPFVDKWMELEIIMLSKISQTQKDEYHIFAHVRNLDFKKKMM
jgi:hypothetical protein